MSRKSWSTSSLNNKKTDIAYQVQYSLPLIEKYNDTLVPLIREMAKETKILMFDNVVYDAMWGMPLIKRTAFLRKRWYAKFRAVARQIAKDVVNTSKQRAVYTMGRELARLKDKIATREVTNAKEIRRDRNV